MSTKKCALTITSLRARKEMLMNQLKNTSLFCLQIVKKLVGNNINNAAAKRSREIIVELRNDKHAYNKFYNAFVSKFQHFEFFVDLIATTSVELLKIHEFVERNVDDKLVEDPVAELYSHVLKVCYMRPSLLHDDDMNGTNITYLMNTFDSYVDNLITIRQPIESSFSTLTVSNLEQKSNDIDGDTDDDDIYDPLASFEEKQQTRRNPIRVNIG
jgi:hypothetical protein